MQAFFRNLFTAVFPVLLRLIASQIEDYFSKEGDS